MGKLLTAVLLFTLVACQSESRLSEKGNHGLGKVLLVTPGGDEVKVVLAVTQDEQVKGLSSVQKEQFEQDEGMLFYYFTDEERHFWMPDTYFDLDIIFLDRSLKILDIVRKVPHYIGREHPQNIPRVRPVWARHALEMRADSPISAKLKIGDKLDWRSSVPLQEADVKLRSLQNP